ncbi:MAG: hypothetical protein AAB639_02525 [Patescibacteria group bacterium]
MKRFDILFYSLLALGLAIGASRFFSFSAQPTYQLTTILAVVVYYVLWGLAYHSIKKDLRRSLFLEYLAIAAVGVVVGILVFYV